jgi:dipeptidase D
MPTTERVFQIFKELNQIPRPSHHEERVADTRADDGSV